MSEQSKSSDEDLDGIKATREGTKQPSNQEGRVLQARREEGGEGEGLRRLLEDKCTKVKEPINY